MKSRGYTVFLICFKIIFSLLGISAVINEIVTLVSNGTFVPSNFFSFFTIQSNVFAAVVLAIGAVALIRNKKSPRVDALRGAATLYMAITGIVFALLLSGLDAKVLTAVPWDNKVLHYIIPVVMIIDWIADAPSAKIRKRTVLLWLIYPLAYLAYTLIRGPLVHWYPYPFVNPANGGYGQVVKMCVIITAGVVIGGFAIRARSLLPARSSRK